MHNENDNDQLLVDRYLRGDLTDAEAERFEEYFLSNPDVLDELELVEKLRQGMQDIEAIESVHEAEPQPAPRWSFFRSRQYAAAATVLLLVSMTVSSLLFQRVEQLEVFDAVAPEGDVQLIPLMTVRGAGADENLIQAAANDQLVLLLDAGPTEHASYRVTLRRVGADEEVDPVWERSGLSRGYEDMLVIALPAMRLTAGNYRLRVEGQQAESPTNRDFEFVSDVEFGIELTHD